MINTIPQERSKEELKQLKEFCFKTIESIFWMNWSRDSDSKGNPKYDVIKYDSAKALLLEAFQLFEESFDY